MTYYNWSVDLERQYKNTVLWTSDSEKGSGLLLTRLDSKYGVCNRQAWEDCTTHPKRHSETIPQLSFQVARNIHRYEATDEIWESQAWTAVANFETGDDDET